MKALLHLLFTISIITCFSSHLMSAHIIGGQMSYELLSYNADSTEATYAIELTLFRDALGGGSQFDNSAKFGSFEEIAPGEWQLFSEVRRDHSEITTITSGADSCLSGIGNVRIEKTRYYFIMQLPVSDRSYMIAYQRCCRSEIVNNLLNPEETGAAYTITITPEAQRLGNSSPKASQEPIFFACAGEPFMSENTSVDAEGDSLVYKFCSPLASGGIYDAMQTGNLGCCICVRPDPYNVYLLLMRLFLQIHTLQKCHLVKILLSHWIPKPV